VALESGSSRDEARLALGQGAGKLAGNGAMDAFNGTQFTWSAATTGGTQAASTSGSNSNSSSGGGSTYPGY